MAALRAAMGGDPSKIATARGACVFVARLAEKGENFECGAPCVECDKVLTREALNPRGPKPKGP